MAIESPAARYELSQKQAQSSDDILEVAQVRELYFRNEAPWCVEKRSNIFSTQIMNYQDGGMLSDNQLHSRHQNVELKTDKLCQHCGGNNFDNYSKFSEN